MIGRLHVDLAASSLAHLAPVIQALEIDALRLHVTRTASGRYDVDDLIRKLTPQPGGPPAEPQPFALYNVQLRDAAFRFDDLPLSRVHEISALHLALPFLSNLPAEVDIKVEPHLSFVLDGARFDSGALATPFARTRAGNLKMTLGDLDLTRYVGYLPDSLPVRIKSGKLSTDLAIEFALPSGRPPTLMLRGTASIRDAALTEPGGAPLIGWRRLAIAVRELAPLARSLALSSVEIDGAELTASRRADGRINLMSLAASSAQRTPSGTSSNSLRAASSPASAVVPSATSTSAPAPNPWRVAIERLRLVDSKVLWTDAAVPSGASMRLEGLAIGLDKLRWPVANPVAVTAAGTLRVGAAADAGSFSVEGTATDHRAELGINLRDLALQALRPYLAQVLVPTVSGEVSASAKVDWSGDAESPRLKMTLATGRVERLALSDPDGAAGQSLASMKRFEIGDVQIDLQARKVEAGHVGLDQPSLSLGRDRAGHFDVVRWLATEPGASTSPAAEPASGHGTAPLLPWRVEVADLLLSDGRMQFTDASAAGVTAERPLRVGVTGLRLAGQHLAWQGGRPTVPAQLELSGQLGPADAMAERAPRSAGSFAWRGVFGTAPLLAIGSLRVERFPAHLFMPYLGNPLALRLGHAEIGYAGNLSIKQLDKGLDVDAAADLLFGAVRVDGLASDAGPADTLLSWNALALKGARLSLKPGAKPQLDIVQAVLSDLRSHLVLTEQGRLNLSTVASPAASAPGGEAASIPLRGTTGPGPAVADAPPTAPAPPLPIAVRLGGITLTNGRIDFSDHFVRPNYSAALTELNGQLGAIDSESPVLATLSLQGKAAGTAILDIGGRLNPFATPMALAIHAKATDLELAPLSPYAGKYAGYAIERGKLSLQVDYQLDADGKLVATNQLTLNQLTFGEKIESASATKLPVLLAVALLKDRRGVIDLNLPISGSVNDPQFSVGSIVAKLLLNLLVKAVTSPFSLLGGGAGGGGGDEMSQVQFLPGTTELAPRGAASIDQVALALAEKPALMMTVTGAADAAIEQDAYRLAALEARLQAARRKESIASAAAASAPPAALSTEDRTRLLKQVYQDSDLPTKSRNALGFAKDVPAPEMEALLTGSIPVSADDLRELALQRGVVVRDALIAKGLPSERLFLAAPDLRSAAPDGSDTWVPQARLSLSVR